MSFVQGPTNSQIVKHFGTDLSPEVQSKLKDIFDIYSEMTLEEKMDQVFKASVLTALRVNSHDEQFEFHFYDMDFCRQAEVKGVTMGTIPLSLMHESGGNFSSEAWKQGYQKYIQKWKE